MIKQIIPVCKFVAFLSFICIWGIGVVFSYIMLAGEPLGITINGQTAYLDIPHFYLVSNIVIAMISMVGILIYLTIKIVKFNKNNMRSIDNDIKGKNGNE